MTLPTGVVNVANITFKVVGNPGDTSVLHINATTLSDTSGSQISPTNSIDGSVTAQGSVPVPTLSQWGMIILCLLLGLASIVIMKKKRGSAFIIAFLIAASLFFLMEGSVQAGILGDANADGDVNIEDADLISRFLVGLVPSLPEPDDADVNGDGKVDIIDAMIIAQYANYLRDELPRNRLRAIPGADPTSGNAPLTVYFTTNGEDPKGTIEVYRWDFDGDGTFDYSSATTANTPHTYQNPGTYAAVFRVTDNEGATATASATATAIRVGPPGSPTATGTATPSIGPAPLNVNFNGTGTDPDGTIVLYEWDYTNDGTYDYSSAASAVTSHTYNEPGKYVAAFRVTDNDGKTGIDLLDITVELAVGLSIADPDKTVNPTDGEEIGIDVTVNASVPASIQIRNSAGITILIIPVTTPTSSPDRYNWDGKDDSGFIVNDGVYYAILRYQYEGEWKNYDLTHTTGGQRYSFPFGSGCDTRDNIRSTFDPFEDDLLPMGFRLCSAQKVTGFIGPLWTGGDETRIRTLLNQEAFSAGEHTIYWDGLNDDGNVAEPPPSDSLITGFWRYSLPDNAIYVTGGRPVVTNVSADPNYFSPFSEKCDQYGNGEGINLTYTVSENVASVKLRVYSPETGRIERDIINNTVTAGEHTIFWDGKNGSGEYVDIGDYQIGVFAEDTEGNTSMWHYTLVRIDY